MGAAARLAFTLARRTPFVFRVAYGTLAWIVTRYPALNFRLNEATPPDRETLARPEVKANLSRVRSGRTVLYSIGRIDRTSQFPSAARGNAQRTYTLPHWILPWGSGRRG